LTLTAARKHNCWIAAGSSFIPEVEDIPDEISEETVSALCPRITNPYKLFNSSFLFNNRGQVAGKFSKCFTIDDEKFLDRSNPDEWQAAKTPFGTPLGVSQMRAALC
jgi:predicted amidohydrolase